jgi:hypothetical protein
MVNRIAVGSTIVADEIVTKQNDGIKLFFRVDHSYSVSVFNIGHLSVNEGTCGFQVNSMPSVFRRAGHSDLPVYGL